MCIPAQATHAKQKKPRNKLCPTLHVLRLCFIHDHNLVIYYEDNESNGMGLQCSVHETAFGFL